MEIHLPKIYFRPTFLHAGTRATKKKKKKKKKKKGYESFKLDETAKARGISGP